MIEKHLKLFGCLNENGVEYLLIGGTLAIAYGVPRVTKDIDIFINPTLDNAARLLAALKKIGMGTADLTNAGDICSAEVTIFKDFIRLDVLTSVTGLEFGKAWQNKVYLSLDDIDIPAISLDDLIKAKKASGRPPDLEDIKILEMARKQKKPI